MIKKRCTGFLGWINNDIPYILVYILVSREYKKNAPMREIWRNGRQGVSI